MIYLDNAATTFYKPEEVIEAVAYAMRHMGNAGRGAHEISLDASRMIYNTRQELSDLFGLGNPSRVAFTANATESLNMVIQGLLEPGDHVITTMMEHNSVLRPLYRMEKQGVELSIIKVDPKGKISYEDFEQEIRENTKAIICTHVSNLTGDMIDLKCVGDICRKHKLLLVLDASQSAGVIDIDMQKMGIDVLCFTGHKGLLGPQGTGGICVREGVEIRPLLEGGSGVQTYLKHHPTDMPTALEAGTLNGHGIAGLYAALEYIKKTGMQNIRERETHLMNRFYNGVKQVEGVTIYGNFQVKERAPIVTINIREYDSGHVADELAVTYEILTRAGAHCAPLMHKALGTVEQGAVRFSFSYHNTEEEIDKAIQAVGEIVKDGL